MTSVERVWDVNDSTIPRSWPQLNPAVELHMEEEAEWREKAACRTGTAEVTRLFFSTNPMEIMSAKAICAECPAARFCLEAALKRREPWGVWGGELIEDGKIAGTRYRHSR